MLRTIDLRAANLTRADLARAVPRAAVDVDSATETAAALIADVRARGESALRDQAERLDGVRPERIRLHADDLSRAVRGLDREVRAALELAIERVRAASRAQLPEGAVTDVVPGGRIIQRWVPVERVGLYVPGGKAVYPSSVIMNVVPAQAAGVSSIALASPPQAAFDGSVHPVILGAAGLLGIEEVYAMGGAGAIGALAYGVPELDLDPVDLVTGPGNVYVAAAKRLIRGVAGIDSEAGPTEILVIADASADPVLVAADLVSQAEHDELAASVLVTDSPELALSVAAEVERQAATTRHADRVRAALTGEQSAIVLGRLAGHGDGVQQRLRPGAPRGADGRAGGGARPAHERRRHLPRPGFAGEPRRLRRRLEPRAAHRRSGEILVGPRRDDLPALRSR